MGAKQSSLDDHIKPLPKEELEIVTEIFKSICVTHPDKGCTYSEFVTFCEQVHPLLTQFLIEFYFGKQTEGMISSVKEFAAIYSILVRGTIEERAKLCEILMLGVKDDKEHGYASMAVLRHRKFLHLEINYSAEKRSFDMRQGNFIRGIICSYIKIEYTSECKEFHSWRKIKAKFSIKDIDKFALCLTETLHYPFTPEEMNKWVANWATIRLMCEIILNHMFGICGEMLFRLRTLYPLCSSKHNNVGLMDMCSIIHLNSHLPFTFRHLWRLLFSSAVHGTNFRHLLEKIVNEGPSLVLIRDKNDYVFGGFASDSWHGSSGKFYGSCSSFLFQLEPNLKIYESSGKDDNYQIMHLGDSRGSPKGFGMGKGTMELYGWWIEPERLKGSCAISCSTFQDLPILASSQNFLIDRFEIWAVSSRKGKLKKAEQNVKIHAFTEPTNFVTDSNIKGRTLLKRTGTRRYTDGYMIHKAERKFKETEEDKDEEAEEDEEEEEDDDDEESDDDDDDDDDDSDESVSKDHKSHSGHHKHSSNNPTDHRKGSHPTDHKKGSHPTDHSKKSSHITDQNKKSSRSHKGQPRTSHQRSSSKK